MQINIIVLITIIIIICRQYFVNCAPTSEEKIDVELRLNTSADQRNHRVQPNYEQLPNFIDLTLSDDDGHDDRMDDDKGVGSASNIYDCWKEAVKEKALIDRKVKEIIRISLAYLNIKWDMEEDLVNLSVNLCDKIAESIVSPKDPLNSIKTFLKNCSKIRNMFDEISPKIRAEVMEFAKNYEAEIRQSFDELTQIDHSFVENADTIKKMLEQLYLFDRLYRNLETLREKQICPALYVPTVYIQSMCHDIELRMIEIATEFGFPRDDILKIMLLK